MGGRVLVVDDDQTVSEVVVGYLQRAGLEVQAAADGEQALRLAENMPPDLVVLDLMLPGIDGLEVCRRLRRTSTVPIIMLTALGEESDRVSGFEHGADDYVAKPFSPRELVLRVESILRRVADGSPQQLPTPERILSTGPLRLDTDSHEITLSGNELALTSREFDLLAFLMAHPRRVFSREELMALVWGWSFGDRSTVTVHIRRLREKVEEDPGHPRLLATVWGVGYRLDPEGVGGESGGAS